MGIKIGIDPSGTGTTAIVICEDSILLHEKEFINNDWKDHYKFIDNNLSFYNSFRLDNKQQLEDFIFNIENCLYTNANGSKDRDDLLRLLGAIENTWVSYNWLSPRHTKSVVKNMENLSKYNDSSVWKIKEQLLMIMF